MPSQPAHPSISISRRHCVRALSGLAGAGSLGVLGPLAGCGSNPSESVEAIAPSLQGTTPDDQAATYRNVDRLNATRRIARSDSVTPLEAHPVSLHGLRYVSGSGSGTVDDFMTKSRSAGILILKDGRVALERYGMGNTERSRWTSFSVAKSLTSTLVGLAVHDGSIRSLDDSVDLYEPRLRGSAYEGCSIRNLLRMSSGVRWNEQYTDAGSSDVFALVQAIAADRPGAVLALIQRLARAAPQGTVFNYSTGESHVLGLTLAAAIRGNLSDYASRRIWQPAGMEADGYWMLDASGGTEMGGNNFSATLRDYGRLGLFMLRGGAGPSVLPDGWAALAGRPDNPVTSYGRLYPGYPLGYGYHWWAFPDGPEMAPHQGAFIAQGIYGQFIYVNPAHRVVAVLWSAWPEPVVSELEAEAYAFIGTAVASLAGAA